MNGGDRGRRKQLRGKARTPKLSLCGVLPWWSSWARRRGGWRAERGCRRRNARGLLLRISIMI